MSEINDQLNDLFDSMSEEDEVELSEELGIERADEGYKPFPADKVTRKVNSLDAEKALGMGSSKKDKRRMKMDMAVYVDKDPELRGMHRSAKQQKEKQNREKGIREDHIQATADRLGKFIANEDKKQRAFYDAEQNLTEEERRDRKMAILENEVSKLSQITKAHFPGDSGPQNTLVSGIGNQGDGSNTGGGAVWLWDLDDVEIGTPLNGVYPPISNGAVLVYNSSTNMWGAGASGSAGAVNTAGVSLVSPVTPAAVPLTDLPPIPAGGLNTQQETNQYIMSALIDLDSKIQGGADDDIEMDGDLDFIATSTQSIRKYNGGELDIKVGADEDSLVIAGQFTTTGLTLPSKTLAAQAVSSTTGAFSGAVTIHTLTTGAEAGVAINAAAGSVSAQWLNVGVNATTDQADANYGVSLRTTGKFISPETNVTVLSGSRQGVVYKLVAGDGVAFDGQASTHIGGTVGNDYNTNVGTLKVNATVLRTTGSQIITGDKTYTGSTADAKSLMTREAVTALSPSGGFKFQGTCDVTLPRDNAANSTVAEDPGNFYINVTAGTAFNSGTAAQNWTGIGGLSIAADQLIIWSEVNSRFFAGSVEGASVYMPKSAGTGNPFTGQVVIGAATNDTELTVLAYGSHVAKQLDNESSSGKLLTKAKDNTTGWVAYPGGSTEQLGSITLKGTGNTKTIRIKGGNGNSIRLQVSNDLESESNPTYTTVFSSTSTQTNLEKYTEAKQGLKVLSAKTEINAGMQINNNTIPSSNVVFDILGSTMSSTDGTGSVTTGSVLSCTKHSDGTAGTITYAGAQNYSNGIMNRAGIQKLIGEKALGTTGGVIIATGGSTDTSGNLTVRASDDSSNGRLIVKNAAGDILFKAYPTGTVDMGDTLNFKGSNNDKNIKAVGNTATKVKFSFGSTTDSVTESCMISASGVHSYGFIKVLDGTQETLVLKEDGNIMMTGTSANKDFKVYGATSSKLRFFAGDVSAPSTVQLEIDKSAVNIKNVPLQVSTSNFVVGTDGAVSTSKTLSVAGRSTLKGIIMDGYSSDDAFSTKGANFISADNAGSFLNITKQGGTSGNYIGIGAAQNPVSDGRFRILQVGTDANNKRIAKVAVDTDDGLITASSIWNKNVANKYGVVTSLSSTYSLDGDGNALDATQYQMNAKFFFNRPIADNAAGTGFELQGCTAADPTNTSAKLLEVYHNTNSAGTGDALNYFGRTDGDNNVQTKSSLTSFTSNLAKKDEHNTFTDRQSIHKGIKIEKADDDTSGALSFHMAGTNGARNAYVLFQGAGSTDGTTYIANYIFARDTVTSNVSASDKYFTLKAPYGNSGTVKTVFHQPVEGPTPTANSHLATKEYVDSHSNSISGGQQSGTFTLTFDGTGTVPGSPQTCTAHYRKIGHITHVHFTAKSLNFTGYAGGAIRMKGLPFAPDTTVGEQIGNIHAVGAIVNNYHADDGHIAVVGKDATYGNFIYVLSEQVSQETTYIPNATGATIRVSVTYIADS